MSPPKKRPAPAKAPPYASEEIVELRRWAEVETLVSPEGAPASERGRLILGLIDFYEQNRSDEP